MNKKQLEELLSNNLRTISDFPKPGINFFDITTLLKDAESFRRIVDYFVDIHRSDLPSAIVGIESRGFIFGPTLSYVLNLPFIPVRKPGKLPAPVEKVEYDLEYGSDILEIHKDSLEPGDRVIIVDDLLATGGTAKATVELIQKLQAEVISCDVIIELDFLAGRKKLDGVSVNSILRFDGD